MRYVLREIWGFELMRIGGNWFCGCLVGVGGAFFECVAAERCGGGCMSRFRVPLFDVESATDA